MRFSFNILFLISVIFFAISCKKGETVDNAASVDQDVHLFKLLPTEESGLFFSNTITETFQDNILINSYLYNGGGVGVIDINNDGLQDLYFTATQESNKLFLNKGGMKFEDITATAGVGAPEGVKTGVSIADVNADGWQDIYVCRSGMTPNPNRRNLLFINNGDLTFTEKGVEFGLADAAASNQANFFDFDLDGDLDVYVLNHPVDYANVNKVNVTQDGSKYKRISTPPPGNEWDSDNFYRNEGNGKFTSIGKEAGVFNRAWGLSVTVSDFNNDNYPDVFVGNDYIEPDLLYINDKKGGFSIKTDSYFRHTSNHTMGADIADINNDGLVDLIALDMIAEDFSRQKELMTTMMLDRYNSLVRFGYGHQVMRNVLQINTGRSVDQGFVYSEIGELSGIASTDWSWSPLLFDADNDGLKDLHITNGYRRDVSNLDYLAYISPQLAPGGQFNTAITPTMDDYLKNIPSVPLSNYMFKNTNGNSFTEMADKWGLDDAGFSNGSAYADLDNDGDLDLVVNNLQDDIKLYMNKASDMATSNWIQFQPIGEGGNLAAIGTSVEVVTNDGAVQYQELYPVRGFLSSSQAVLHFGIGANKAVKKATIKWPNGKVQVIENIEANQKISVNIADSASNNFSKNIAQEMFAEANNTGISFRHIEDEFEDFNKERLLPNRFSKLGPCIATADVNGDGLTDLFVGGAKGHQGALFIQNSSSKFTQVKNQGWENDSQHEDTGCHFFDADGDGDFDLYVASGGNSDEFQSEFYQDRLYLNNGQGQFLKAVDQLPNVYSSTAAIVDLDIDNDGDLDLIVGGNVSPGNFPTPPISMILMNENGKFIDYCGQLSAAFQRLGMITDLKIVDLNADGKYELLACGLWMNIRVFEISNSQLQDKTVEYGLDQFSGWWNCIEAADMDNDGDLDLVAGNLGLNTRFPATIENPMRIFSDDFDKNGSIDPILTYSETGLDFPLLPRDMLIKQMPSIKKKFVNYKDYCSATIHDVFDKNQVSGAQMSTANWLASSYFENKNGKFTISKLPIEAQTSPINDVVIEDVNQDGNLDILGIGNNYSMAVETGRLDAGNGVILLGDGKGGFRNLPNIKSGFWAVRDAKHVESLPLANGNILYIVANNNDNLETYILTK